VSPSTLVIAALIAAQPSLPSSLTFEQLQSRVPSPPPATGGGGTPAQELTITLVTPRTATPGPGVSAPPPPSQIEVASRRRNVGRVPVERRPELSTDLLVVVGAGSGGDILSWSLARDPRLIRAEQPGPDGLLSGRILYRESADLLVVLPDVPQITQAAIYQPRWTGSEWQLDLIGVAGIGAGR